MKSNMQLIDQISKMEPLDFVGLAKLLGVQVIEQNNDIDGEKQLNVRNFSDVFADVMAKFNGLNRTRKREILKLVKKSNAARGGKDYAGTSTNS